MSATLAGALPTTQAAYDALSAYAASALGVTLGVADYGGFRTPQDTTDILVFRADDYNAALASGAIRASMTIDQYRPIAQYGLSYHDFGAAFDVSIVAKPSGASDSAVYAQLGAVAPSLGLRWGGTFTNADPAHFELAVTLDEAAVMYQAYQTSGAGSGDSNTLMALAAAVAAGAVIWAVQRKGRRHAS